MELHIGQMVKQRMLQLQMKPTVFAKQLGVSYKHVQQLYNRQEYHCTLLRKVSQVLEYDFFQHYTSVNAMQLETLNKKIEVLEKENASLKYENKLLVQANNWLSKGK
ncbi:MAG: hypothetical protein ACYDCN_14010 [Bacteroidia bacterium]